MPGRGGGTYHFLIMLTYSDATSYLFNCLPAFEKSGTAGYKPGLDRVVRLSETFGSPHERLKHVVHIAGTNGKGSTAHTIAAILQSQGYKTGLFTSPHLVDFRERIRVNGKMISEREVVRFVDQFQNMPVDVQPSFFELTTIMALKHFVDEDVDVAVVEVGLGGRLDSTNIVNPDLSVITNIALDHTDLLGATRREIAAEKAGIIKPGIPVVVGETDDEIRPVFEDACLGAHSPLIFAEEHGPIMETFEQADKMVYKTKDHGIIYGSLTGGCQIKNATTILAAIDQLNKAGMKISDEAIHAGFQDVAALTGLSGRWEIVSRKPLTVCDTGHNPAGWAYNVERIETLPGCRHLVVGFVADKDVKEILRMLADRRMTNVRYYFVQPDSHRALPAEELAEMALEVGLKGCVVGSVADGYEKALADAGEDDSIFIGGSNYVVAEVIPLIKKQ